MNTLQNIQEGWNINYGAVFKFKPLQKYNFPSGKFQIVSMNEGGNFIFINEYGNSDMLHTNFKVEMEQVKIIEFKYMGELGGNEPIKAGRI